MQRDISCLAFIAIGPGFRLVSCICNLLHKAAARGSLLRQVGERFTFIGPAPCALFGALRGDAADQRVQLRCLQDLRQVRDWIAEELGVQHALYNLQITPRDWQHFLRARENFPADGTPSAGTRGGSASATQRLLLNLALHKEEMMRARAAAMMQLEWVQRSLGVLKLRALDSEVPKRRM